MRFIRGLLLVSIVLIAGSLLAQNGYSPPPGWVSYPNPLTANPNLTAAFQRYNTVPGRYDRNGDGRFDLIVADRNGDGMGD